MHNARWCFPPSSAGFSDMDARLRAVMAEILDLEPESLEDDMSRQDTDTWDSLTHLRLITAVESTFGVKLTMDEIAAVDTPRTLENFIRAHGGLYE
jgi:acyl carrier protein